MNRGNSGDMQQNRLRLFLPMSVLVPSITPLNLGANLSLQFPVSITIYASDKDAPYTRLQALIFLSTPLEKEMLILQF